MGFLPIWIKASDEISVDIGALTGNIKSSIPNFNGEPIEVFDYQNELMEGFSALYEFFSENRETLTDDIRNIFAKAVLRIIIRPTQVYFKMLYHTLSPEFLKDGFLYSLEIERFAPAFLIKVEEDKVNKIWDIFLSERDALEERDIPIFHGYADALDIRGHDKILSEEYFADTALDRVIKKINALNHDDKARQLDFIKESLSIYQTGCHSEKKRLNCDLDLKDPDAAHRHDLLAEARSISRDIMEKSIYLGEKGFAWICYSHDLAGNKVSIGQTTYSLYDGVWGIALFIAALYRLTEEETIRSQALMLIQPFIEALYNKTYPLPVYRMRIGWGDGLGGIIKSLVMIGDYLRYDSLYDDALYLIDRITREQIKKAQDKTVYGGLAGIMTALLTCFERFQHQYSLELATLCGEQILKNQQYLDNIGLGCGNSGIICALARLYDVTHEPHFSDAIQEMARYNANLYNRRVCQKVPGSTCSGIAGLGLACLAMPLGSDNIQVDMNQVIEQILTYPMYYGDHLCCGNSGRVDFLVEASLRLNRPELLQEADRRLQWMINRQRESGHFHIEGSSSLAISNPSFFQGLSGIGYEMLRCTAPHMIGSVFY
jgi:type 2 lantibiotic biosynthesis protein LanM